MYCDETHFTEEVVTIQMSQDIKKQYVKFFFGRYVWDSKSTEQYLNTLKSKVLKSKKRKSREYTEN